MLVRGGRQASARKWAIVAPNYEYGQSAVKWFKELLKKAKPDVEFVAEQFPALGRIDAGATVQALEASKPEAIFNVTFGADLSNFVRQGNTRGLFEGRAVVSMLTGRAGISRSARRRGAGRLGSSPAIRRPRSRPPSTSSSATPTWPSSTTIRVSARSSLRHHELDRRGADQGGLDRHRETGRCAQRPEVPSAFGSAEYRAVDHQSTLGAYVGRPRSRTARASWSTGAMPGRREVSAERRRGEGAPPGGVKPVIPGHREADEPGTHDGVERNSGRCRRSKPVVGSGFGLSAAPE